MKKYTELIAKNMLMLLVIIISSLFIIVGFIYKAIERGFKNGVELWCDFGDYVNRS